MNGRMKEQEAYRRHKEHEADLRVKDRRREWRPGDHTFCWEQTNEERKFGIIPPLPPTYFNRSDILDLE